MNKQVKVKLRMTPFREIGNLITHTTYECELNKKRITVIDCHNNGRTIVYFPDNSNIEFPNQIESRAKLPYNIWLLKQLSKIDDLHKRLTEPPPEGVPMNKLAPKYKFDQLQAWMILTEFLAMNPNLPNRDDRPQIVKDAIETLDLSINQGMKGEQEIDEDGNRIGEPEIVVRLSECQSESWNEEVKENSQELNKELPLWKERKIRIKGFSQSLHHVPDSQYDYEVILTDNKIGYQGTFNAERWMSHENIRNAIAEMFCPPGYNFNTATFTFHFENPNNIVYKFKYCRNGADNSHNAAGW